MAFNEKYKLVVKIGSGSYGNVYQGINQFTKEKVAVKVIEKKTLKKKELEQIVNEIGILKAN